MYVILGASGQVGGSVLKALELLDPDARLRAVSRRIPQAKADGVDWQTLDASRDIDGLARVLEGAEAAFVMNPVPPDSAEVYADAAAISHTIAAALAKARCPRVVALSSQGAHLPAGTGIIRTLHDFETALRRTSAALTCMRSTFFMESWLPFAAAALDSGEWLAMRDPADAPDAEQSRRMR